MTYPSCTQMSQKYNLFSISLAVRKCHIENGGWHEQKTKKKKKKTMVIFFLNFLQTYNTSLVKIILKKKKHMVQNRQVTPEYCTKRDNGLILLVGKTISPTSQTQFRKFHPSIFVLKHVHKFWKAINCIFFLFCLTFCVEMTFDLHSGRVPSRSNRCHCHWKMMKTMTMMSLNCWRTPSSLLLVWPYKLPLPSCTFPCL